jgi:hypothetical protein
MAAREFQRFFGQCAGGRETDNRAKQACDDDALRPLRKLPRFTKLEYLILNQFS